MSEEFNLSNKEQDYGHSGVHFYAYPEEDVKEFIKRLKEGLVCNEEVPCNNMRKLIDKLAGEKLV